MATRSRLISGIYQYCANPDDCPLTEGGLPLQTAYEVAVDVENGMLLDLGLSDQNRTVTSEIVNLNSNTQLFSLASSDFGAPSHVRLKMNSSDTWWYPVDIVNQASLLQAGLDGRVAVSFYGSPQSGEVSWIPDGQQQLTVWYDRTPDEDGDLLDESIVAYHTHLKLQAAAQCRELMGLDVGDVLATRLAKGEKQWRQFVSMSRQQGVIEKPMWRPNSRRYYGGTRYGEGGFRLP